MKFTTAVLVGSLAAGALADRSERHARHVRLHEKRTPVPTDSDIMNVVRSDRTLSKRCGEMIYTKMPGSGAPMSFKNCWGACASDSACTGGSAPAAAPSPVAAPVAASTPAAQDNQSSHSQTNSGDKGGNKGSGSSSSSNNNNNNNNNNNKGSGSSSSGGSSSSPPASSSGGGKKGLSYNDGSLLNSGAWSGASWAYDWTYTSDGLTASGIQFIPMLHDTGAIAGFTSAVAGIAKDTPLLSFNEPDMSTSVGGSLIDPATAAAKHLAVMGPLRAAGHPISAPAVSSSATAGQGLSWLESFATSCGGNCPVDFCAIHWYGWNAAASAQATQFQSYIGQAAQTCDKLWPGKKLWITEFAASGPSGINDVETNAEFLKIVGPWLESQGSVERYSPFMVGNGDALGGSTPSAAGQALLAA